MFWKKPEYTDDQKLARMREARQILDSDLFKEAFDMVRERYYDTFINSNLMDTKLREKLFLAQGTVEGVKAHLIGVMNEGEITEQQVKKGL